MKRILSIALAAALLAPLPISTVSAQEPAANNQTFTYFDESVIRMAMEPRGATVEKRDRENGKPFFMVTLDDVKVLAIPASCGEGNDRCVGLGLVVLYESNNAVSKTELLNLINDFNRQNDFVKVVLNKNGTVSVIRYTISDHKNVIGNLRAQFSNLAASAKRYDAEFTKFAQEKGG